MQMAFGDVMDFNASVLMHRQARDAATAILFEQVRKMTRFAREMPGLIHVGKAITFTVDFQHTTALKNRTSSVRRGPWCVVRQE
jgi:hypothetical protein